MAEELNLEKEIDLLIGTFGKSFGAAGAFLVGSETLIESFMDSDSMMVRLANHGASPIATEVFEQVDINSVLCLGNAKQDAIEALSAWGTNFQKHHCGYNRSEVVNPR